MAKGLLHCIGKYTKGSGIEDALLETEVFGVNIVEQFLNGTHYVKSFRGLLILAEALDCMKWQAFWLSNDKEKYSEAINQLTSLQVASLSKDPNQSQKLYEECIPAVMKLKEDFDSFSENCGQKSEMCRYLNGIIKLSHLKSLIASDRSGDWEEHLQSVQDILPIFRECDSIHYLRYEKIT